MVTLEEAKKTSIWMDLIKNPSTLSIFLHGSILENGSGHDVDILVVQEKVDFSNRANELLLGFEHVRHSEDFDVYFTDREHFTLAKEILRTSKEPIFEREKLIENIEVISRSFDLGDILDRKLVEKMVQKGEEIARGNPNFLSKRISKFWLFDARKSWENWYKERKENEQEKER